jgi:hypothetical protein
VLCKKLRCGNALVLGVGDDARGPHR